MSPILLVLQRIAQLSFRCRELGGSLCDLGFESFGQFGLGLFEPDRVSDVDDVGQGRRRAAAALNARAWSSTQR